MSQSNEEEVGSVVEYLLTYEEAADIFDVTVQSVRNWVKLGALKTYRIKKKDSPEDPREARSMVFFTKDDLLSFAMARSQIEELRRKGGYK